jgi:osmotically-inducible protein OsmY
MFIQKVKAGDIVMRVSGVKDIEDNIAVKDQGAAGTGQPETDQSLKTVVRSILSENPGYKYEEVNVAASEDTVQLSGFVNTAEQKNRAGDLARAVPGVRNVLNNITVKVIL